MRCDANSKCPCVILILGQGLHAHLSAKYEPATGVLSNSLAIAWHGTLHETDVDVSVLLRQASPVIVKAGPRSIEFMQSMLQALESALWGLLIPQGWLPDALIPAPASAAPDVAE